MNILTKAAVLGLLAVMLLTTTSALAGDIKITFPKEMVEAAQNQSSGNVPGLEPDTREDPIVIDITNPFPGVGKPGINLSVIDPKAIKFLPRPKLELIPVEKGAIRKADNGVLLALGCVVAGDPATLVLVNQSNVTLPEGTRVSWRMRGGVGGYFALNAGLEAGASFAANGIGAIVAGTNCSAKVM